MIGAVVGDYFGGSTESLGVQIQSAVALVALRARLGGDRRREHHRDRALRRRSRSPSDSSSAGTRRRARSTSGRECDQIGMRHNQGGSMRKKWLSRGGSVASLAASRSRLAGGSKQQRDEGHGAAEVGHQAAVRRLLRRAGERLLQAGGPRREDQGRRPGHRSRAGRARWTGRVRRQLAAEPSRTASRATTSSTSRRSTRGAARPR